MMRLLFIGLIFAFVCSSCDSKKQQSNYSGPGKVDYILQDSLTVRESDMIDSVHYIQLETNEQSLIGTVRDLKFYDGKLFILDGSSKDLYVFADDGRFLNKIGAQGRGPEEYSGINNFFLDKTNKWVGIITYGIPRIVFYDFEGKFVKNISGAGISFGPNIMNGTTYKGSLFLYINNYNQPFSVQICDPETLNSRIAMYPYPFKSEILSIWSYFPFAETAEGITFIKPYSDTLFQFDGTSVKPRFIFEHINPLATQQVFDTYYDLKQKNSSMTSGFSEYLTKHNYFQGITGVIETSDYLYIEYDRKYYIWNKKVKKGGIKTMSHVYREEEMYRLRGGIIASTDKCFIAILGYSIMVSLKHEAERGFSIDPGMEKILTEWNEGDNPVVVLYYMKKEI